MLVLGLSTRHTKIGTFRFNVIYEIDQSNHEVWSVVGPLINGDQPALKEISEAEAKKKASAPVQFTPQAKAEKGATAPAELRGAAKASKAAQKVAEKRADDAEAAQKDAEAKLGAVTDELEGVQAKLDDALAELSKSNKDSAATGSQD